MINASKAQLCGLEIFTSFPNVITFKGMQLRITALRLSISNTYIFKIPETTFLLLWRDVEDMNMLKGRFQLFKIETLNQQELELTP